MQDAGPAASDINQMEANQPTIASFLLTTVIVRCKKGGRELELLLKGTRWWVSGDSSIS